MSLFFAGTGRLALRPHQATVLALLHNLARRKRRPQIRKEVGALLNVALTEHGCNSPCCLLAVVEGNATANLLVK
jgi:hypothetical protein